MVGESVSPFTYYLMGEVTVLMSLPKTDGAVLKRYIAHNLVATEQLRPIATFPDDTSRKWYDGGINGTYFACYRMDVLGQYS